MNKVIGWITSLLLISGGLFFLVLVLQSKGIVDFDQVFPPSQEEMWNEPLASPAPPREFDNRFSDYPINHEIKKQISGLEITHQVTYLPEEGLYRYYYRINYPVPNSLVEWEIFNHIQNSDMPVLIELGSVSGNEFVFKSRQPPVMAQGRFALFSMTNMSSGGKVFTQTLSGDIPGPVFDIIAKVSEEEVK